MTTYTKAHKRYYEKKVKPFRKKKQPVAYHSFRCPVCNKRNFMKNLKYNMPFSVDIVMFTGDKGIKWFKGKFDPEQRNYIIQLVRGKIIKAVNEFGITASELGIESIEIRERIEPIEVFRPLFNLTQKRKLNQKVAIPLRQEVKYG